MNLRQFGGGQARDTANIANDAHCACRRCDRHRGRGRHVREFRGRGQASGPSLCACGARAPRKTCPSPNRRLVSHLAVDAGGRPAEADGDHLAIVREDVVGELTWSK